MPTYAPLFHFASLLLYLETLTRALLTSMFLIFIYLDFCVPVCCLVIGLEHYQLLLLHVFGRLHLDLLELI